MHLKQLLSLIFSHIKTVIISVHHSVPYCPLRLKIYNHDLPAQDLQSIS